MKANQVYYPHPVLQNDTDDFINSEFNILIEPKIEQLDYSFIVVTELNNEQLKSLIEEGKASYSIRISCKNTRFRTMINSNTHHFSVKIPSSYLEGKVLFQPLIVASSEINEYTNESFSEDYEGISFKIYKGDTLAIGDGFAFDANKQIDPLIKVPSIFNIIRDDKRNAPPLEINSTGDKVNIVLSKENFEKYALLKGLQRDYKNLAPLVSSLFIVPAIITILEDIKRRIEASGNNREFVIDEMEENHRWFKVLKSKLKELGIELHEPNAFTDSTLNIAYKIVGNPLTQGLKFFDEFHEVRESV
jgi:hypothetical protein